MPAVFTLLALGLATASLAALVAVAIGYEARLRSLARRIQALEGERTLPPRPALETERLLQGIRVALDITQDHSQPVFANLLREALLREDVLVDEPLSPPAERGRGEGTITIRGRLVSNGYADVYFRADLAVAAEGQTLFALTEKPPHGDRPENLAREVVARLKVELEKRERRGALRELEL